MKNRYSISELAELLGVSETSVRKKVKRGDFETVKETVNNRLVTLVLFNDSELDSLLHISEKNKRVYSTETKHSVNVITDEQNTFKSSVIDQNKMIDFFSEYTKRLENLYRELSEKDKTLKMLEVIDKNKEDEINKLRAENKELKERLNKKWWQVWK